MNLIIGIFLSVSLKLFEYSFSVAIRSIVFISNSLNNCLLVLATNDFPTTLTPVLATFLVRKKYMLAVETPTMAIDVNATVAGCSLVYSLKVKAGISSLKISLHLIHFFSLYPFWFNEGSLMTTNSEKL